MNKLGVVMLLLAPFCKAVKLVLQALHANPSQLHHLQDESGNALAIDAKCTTAGEANDQAHVPKANELTDSG